MLSAGVCLILTTRLKLETATISRRLLVLSILQNTPIELMSGSIRPGFYYTASKLLLTLTQDNLHDKTPTTVVLNLPIYCQSSILSNLFQVIVNIVCRYKRSFELFIHHEASAKRRDGLFAILARYGLSNRFFNSD